MSGNLDRLIWTAAVAAFLLGISLPLFTLNKFFILRDTYSLLGGAFYLLKQDELFLSSILFGFSVACPAYKLYLSSRIISGKYKSEEEKLKHIKNLSLAGKWSMADVFVVAILAATVKLGSLANVTVHVGAYVFGIAVLLSMILAQRLLSGYELRPID